MWEAKQAAITLPGASRMMSAMGSARERSDATKPGRSALVESLSKSRTPWRPRAARAGRSVGWPSTGVGSSLKSPECSTIPSGVSKAMAAACGTEWLTLISWKRKGPRLTQRSNSTGWKSGVTPSSSTRPLASSRERRVPYTGTSKSRRK